MLKTTYIETHVCIPWPEKAMQLGMCGLLIGPVHVNMIGYVEASEFLKGKLEIE